SRRRHTRFSRDWSSDVCSSDLNYLLQSIVCTWLFYGHGLGMMRAEPGFAMEFLIALLLFGVQVAASHWWLRRFHFGPAEWAWREIGRASCRERGGRRVVAA